MGESQSTQSETHTCTGRRDKLHAERAHAESPGPTCCKALMKAIRNTTKISCPFKILRTFDNSPLSIKAVLYRYQSGEVSQKVKRQDGNWLGRLVKKKNRNTKGAKVRFFRFWVQSSPSDKGKDTWGKWETSAAIDIP